MHPSTKAHASFAGRAFAGLCWLGVTLAIVLAIGLGCSDDGETDAGEQTKAPVAQASPSASAAGKLPRSTTGSALTAHSAADGPDIVGQGSSTESPATSADAPGATDGATGEALPPEPEEEPGPPQPPEDYGVLVYPEPPPAPDTLTNHALAGYEVVAVYGRPDIESPRLGYMRIGQRVKVGPKLEGAGCKKGFYALPTGGYGCASKGLVVQTDKAPFMKYTPPKPRVEQAMPYDYGYVRKWNTPMYWRVPTPREIEEANKQRAERESERTGEPIPVPGQPAPAPAGDAKAAPAGDAKAPAGDAKALPDVNTPAPAPKPEPKPEPNAEPEEPEEPIKLPLSPAEPWLEKGYFVSLAGKVREKGKSFWRTARGAFVSTGAVHTYKPKDFQGVDLRAQLPDVAPAPTPDPDASPDTPEQASEPLEPPEPIGFPFGFVKKKESKLIELTEEGKLKAVKKLEKRDFVALSEETVVNGRAYMMTTDGLLVRKDHLVMADPQALPKGLEPYDRWIDVSLSKQLLVAYEGTTPVYTTLVSSGKKGTPEEPYDTPKGRWRVTSKHISTTMDGGTASDGNYSIQDVPWTMFFHGSYALHGAFWHRSFGRVRSHGCVNLGPSDARWLFYWTTPFLPEGWHGVNASADSPGTTVIIRD